MSRRRLDAELARRRLTISRAEAQRLIDDGLVLVDGLPARKAATMVTGDQDVRLREPGPGWASRGARKLVDTLPRLGVDPTGRNCLDAGAAHGGFTDVLLRAGASAVVAVDVGYGQLDWRLRSDERVVVLDRTNVRTLEPSALPFRPSLVVADLSFISLTLVLPALRRAATDDADHVLLCKPQFEVGAARVGRGGVVRDHGAWADALSRVAAAGRAEGLGVAGAVASPAPGPAGNVEFLLHLRADAGSPAETLTAAVAEGRRVAARRGPGAAGG